MSFSFIYKDTIVCGPPPSPPLLWCAVVGGLALLPGARCVSELSWLLPQGTRAAATRTIYGSQLILTTMAPHMTANTDDQTYLDQRNKHMYYYIHKWEKSIIYA